ncbi:acetyl-coenzyme A thioesterase-like [Oscarella lobularis]|uniref:acetyl-coenzyme A thioesterase-like n=1 Tax=Oscarella lobularis TaxID=121494 RepID=UPI0033134218
MDPLREPEEEPASKNTTEVEMNQIVTSEYVGETGARFYGVLLKWMDICSCVSAERHAKMACVTVAMDNMKFESNRVKEGNVVQLRAKVNRAFGTSMELGIQVSVENMKTGSVAPLCKAYFTFVARPIDGGKVQLDPIPVNTEEERIEHLLANERRRIRRALSHEIKEVSVGISKRMSAKHFSLAAQKSKKDGIPVARTKAESVELVLPQHANHHKTAFGGQIMEWMVTLAMISASRVCQRTPVPTAVDSVVFRAPAYVGDRVFLKSSVNAVFTTSFEVGVRVDARSISGDYRHINSAFFTFEAIDDNGEAIPPEKLWPQSKEEKLRNDNAQARYWSRLARKSINSKGELLTWSNDQALDLTLENIKRLTGLITIPDDSWKTVSDDGNVQCKRCEQSSDVVVCVSLSVKLPVDAVFDCITNFKERPKWDILCRKVEVVHVESADDCIIRLVLQPSEEGGQPKEFLMLATKRKATSSSDYHALAFTSINFKDFPPSKECIRAESISSGYTVYPDKKLGDGVCSIRYFHKLSSSSLPYISGDLIGLTTLLQLNAAKLKKYIISQAQ